MMNLISCEKCAVVLDGNRMEWPEINGPMGLIEEVAEFIDGEWRPCWPCPVCGAKIPKPKE
jgi:hypothetical protein